MVHTTDLFGQEVTYVVLVSTGAVWFLQYLTVARIKICTVDLLRLEYRVCNPNGTGEGDKRPVL